MFLYDLPANILNFTTNSSIIQIKIPTYFEKYQIKTFISIPFLPQDNNSTFPLLLDGMTPLTLALPLDRRHYFLVTSDNTKTTNGLTYSDPPMLSLNFSMDCVASLFDFTINPRNDTKLFPACTFVVSHLQVGAWRLANDTLLTYRKSLTKFTTKCNNETLITMTQGFKYFALKQNCTLYTDNELLTPTHTYRHDLQLTTSHFTLTPKHIDDRIPHFAWMLNNADSNEMSNDQFYGKSLNAVDTALAHASAASTLEIVAIVIGTIVMIIILFLCLNCVTVCLKK